MQGPAQAERANVTDSSLLFLSKPTFSSECKVQHRQSVPMKLTPHSTLWLQELVPEQDAAVLASRC
ncbi:hypothetical protein DPMN_057831 [Dreissena polymorpha]|uniref:Uncharacterized protein n=1 Tax=Dreissena polymorpha TaxID=45954 RepID=A0A9D4C0U9_DREPO|nr:hypothetical protein DPMN_057831 [Dreissena polymorpha]